MSTTGAELPLDRWTDRRTSFIATTTVLSASEAEAVAYSERGFSDSGIAKRVDATAGTVTTYLNRAVARFGPVVRERRTTDRTAALSPLTPEDILRWPDHRREVWKAAAERYPDYVPDGVDLDLDQDTPEVEA